MSRTQLERAIVHWEALLLLLILPAILFPSPARSLVLLTIPLLWLTRRLTCGYFIPNTPLDSSLLLLLFMVLVSLYATFDLAFSLPKVAGVIYGVAVFYATVGFASRSLKHLWLCVAALLGSGLGTVGLSFLGTEWPQKLPLPLLTTVLEGVPEQILTIPGTGIGFNPNEIAGVLLWIAPVALILAVVATVQAREMAEGFNRLHWLLAIMLWVLASIFLATLLFTQSRAGLLGFVLSLLAATFVGLRRHHRLLLAALLIVVVAVFMLVWTTGIEKLGTQFLTITGLEEGRTSVNTLQSRREIWLRAIYGIQDFPFTGMGMNTFRHLVHILYPLYVIAPDVDIAHAHNHLLQTALDLGIFGLIAYLAVWFGVAGMLYRTWHHTQSLWLRGLTLGLAASLLAYFIYGMLDAVALGARPGFLLWFLFALVAAAYRLISAQTRPV